MIAKDYGIERKGITIRNPQAHAIIERIHQTIGDIIRIFEIQNSDYLDENNPWSGICQERCLLSEQLSTLLSKPPQRNWYLEEMRL
jgi:predicted RNA polymerase sigma factor